MEEGTPARPGGRGRRELTPRQQEIQAELLLLGTERPTPDPEAVTRLVNRARAELSEIGEHAPGNSMVRVTKHNLTSAHACEGRLRAEEHEPFTWSVASVRGRVTHRAIEGQIVRQYRVPPLDLARSAIDEVIATDSYQGSAGEYLAGLSVGECQDLVRDVNDLLVKLEGDWPPILDSWRPRVESRILHRVGRVSLEGRPDLMLGVPRGPEARTLIVDFKTGGEWPGHLQDLRYYALLETLRAKIPPYRVATYYVDSGTFTAEDVDEALLDSALERVVDGARLIARIGTGDEPALTPGWACRFCPARVSCPVADQAPATTIAAG